MDHQLRELHSENDDCEDERIEGAFGKGLATEATLLSVDEPLDESGDLELVLKSITDQSTRSAILISSAMSVVGCMVAVVLFVSLARGVPSMWLLGASMSILAIGTASVFASMNRIFHPGKRRQREILKLVRKADNQQIVPLLNSLQYDDPRIRLEVCHKLIVSVKAISVEDTKHLPDETLAGLALLLAKPGLTGNHPGAEFVDTVSDLAQRMGIQRFLAPLETMARSPNVMLARTAKEPLRVLRRRFGLPHDQETLLRPAEQTGQDLLRAASPNNTSDSANLLQPSSPDESQEDSDVRSAD